MGGIFLIFFKKRRARKRVKMRLLEEERAVPLGIQISPYKGLSLLVEGSSQHNLCGIALGQAASICEAAHVLVYIFNLFIKTLRIVTD